MREVIHLSENEFLKPYNITEYKPRIPKKSNGLWDVPLAPDTQQMSVVNQ